jgi:hypothetical protein
LKSLMFTVFLRTLMRRHSWRRCVLGLTFMLTKELCGFLKALKKFWYQKSNVNWREIRLNLLLKDWHFSCGKFLRLIIDLEMQRVIRNLIKGRSFKQFLLPA